MRQINLAAIAGIWLVAVLSAACSSATTGFQYGAGSGDTRTPPLPIETRTLSDCGSDVTLPDSVTTRVTEYRLDKPSVGRRFSDPSFASCTVRVTDHAAQAPTRYARHAYSRRQAINADGSRLLISSGDGSWHLYDARSAAYVQPLAGVGGAAEPQWHPSNPGLLFHLPPSGRGMQVLELTVGSGQSRVIGDLGERLRAIWPNAAVASTRSEGSPSQTARYWAFFVWSSNGEPLGVVVWDREQDAIVATRNAGIGNNDAGVDVDWVSMSPSGDYVAIAADDRVRAWTRELQYHGELHNATEHADIAIGADGRDMYVSIDFESLDGPVFMRHIDTLQRTDLYSSYVKADGTTRFSSLHISGKGYVRPGWVVVSHYRSRSPRAEWFNNAIVLVELSPNPRMLRVADHRSRYAGYFTEPHASVSSDFTRIVFNSNWYSGDETDVDTYLVEVPEQALSTP